MLKIPPFSEDAEKAILGILLTNSEKIYDLIYYIDEEDFYLPHHKILMRAVKNLFLKNNAIDILTVSSELKENDLLEKAKGIDYLTYLTEIVPTTSNFSTYFEILKDKSLRRNLINLSNQIISEAYDISNETKILIDKIESEILKLTEIDYKDKFIILKELLLNIIDDIENRIKNNIKYSGLQTGFKMLDDITSGFEKGKLIVIAARPSMGKTTFALNLAANMALNYDYNVGFFSLEMPAKDLGYKIISQVTKIPFEDIKRGNLQYSQMHDLIDKISSIYIKNLIFDDTSNITAFDIKQKARRLKVKKNIDIIFIDYLQIISPPKGVHLDNRNVIIGEISKSLKILAKELDIPIVVLSQLSRQVERREDKRPLLSDLRESGAIEQDADIVAFLHREDYYKKKTKEDEKPQGKNVTEFIIEKHRNGRKGKILYEFFPKYSLFKEIGVQED
jgi:replicative DNA helicase